MKIVLAGLFLTCFFISNVNAQSANDSLKFGKFELSADFISGNILSIGEGIVQSIFGTSNHNVAARLANYTED